MKTKQLILNNFNLTFRTPTYIITISKECSADS